MSRQITEIETLRNIIEAAILELDAEHRPQWVKEGGAGYTEVPREDGLDPVGCVMCYPQDGDWPCVTRMITDDLRIP